MKCSKSEVWQALSPFERASGTPRQVCLEHLRTEKNPACCSSEHGRFAVLNRGLRLAKFGLLHIYIQNYISFEIISKSYRLGEGDGGTESWDFGRDGRNPVQAKNAQPKSTWDFWAHGILATVALGELLGSCAASCDEFFRGPWINTQRLTGSGCPNVWGGA